MHIHKVEKYKESEEIAYLLIPISLINSVLALYVAREVLANEEVVSPAIPLVPFQRTHQLLVAVGPECTTPHKGLHLFKSWICHKLHTIYGTITNTLFCFS